MSLQAEKIRLIELLLGTDSPAVLKRIHEVFIQEENHNVESLNTRQLDLLDLAIEQANKGETIDFKDFMTSLSH